jgi:monoamine oxidase
MIDRAGVVTRGPKSTPRLKTKRPAKKPARPRASPPKTPARSERAVFEPATPARAVRTDVKLKDVLAVAALPSSQRIEGWRTKHFDVAKASVSRELEADPKRPLHKLLDMRADIGPVLDKIPSLPDSIARVVARYVKGGMKSDIREVKKLPTDVQDYVIVGAGLAGTSAGAVFEDANAAGANLKGVVLEGTDRLGGRARDVDIHGMKAGLGASWLHGKYNQLRHLADGLGLHRERTFLDRTVFIDGRRATDKEQDELWDYEEAAEDRMRKASLGGWDRLGPASKFFPDGKWQHVAMAEMGAGDQGMTTSKVDPIDGAMFSSNQDDFIQEGMEEFVARFARAAQLPVAFNAQVKSARRGDDGIWNVKLTDGRSLRTRQLIYTGSTSALTNIDFGKDLPVAKTQVPKEALPVGNFTKFLFTTKEPLQTPNIFRNSWAVDATTDKETGKLTEEVQFVLKYGGDPRANIMFTDAGTAKALLAMNESERRAAIEKRFSRLAAQPMHVDQIAATPFAQEKNFRGCYTNLLPGMEGSHTVWAAPVHGLNFAGEAAGTAQNNGSLLAAFTSGVDSAYDVINAVKNKPSRR